MMLNIPLWSSPATRKTRLEEEEEDQERRQSCWETLSSLLSSGLEESQAARQPPVQNWGKSQREVEVEVGFSRSSRHSARQDSTSSLARPSHRAWQVAVIRLGSSRVSSSEVEEAGVMRTVRRKTGAMVIIFMLSGWLLVSD